MLIILFALTLAISPNRIKGQNASGRMLIQNAIYRYKLDIGNPDRLCPETNYTCSDGNPHYLCNSTNQANPPCVCYKQIELNPKDRKSFVEGHNGIRNKVAHDFGISNMNLLYWSDSLSKMAELYLKECKIGYDPCLILGEKKVPVSQNYVLVQNTLTDRWPGRVVRKWYLEIGPAVKNWNDFRQKHLVEALSSFTNMIYPMVEFVGCDAAGLDEGYLIICYYHPPYNRSTFPENFKLGKPASKCSVDRKTRSTVFSNLCGADMDIGKAAIGSMNAYLLLICLFVSFKIYSEI